MKSLGRVVSEQVRHKYCATPLDGPALSLADFLLSVANWHSLVIATARSGEDLADRQHSGNDGTKTRVGRGHCYSARACWAGGPTSAASGGWGPCSPPWVVMNRHPSCPRFVRESPQNDGNRCELLHDETPGQTPFRLIAAGRESGGYRIPPTGRLTRRNCYEPGTPLLRAAM